MNTKLTLTIEKEVIATAKAYAKEKGQSLSDLVENYFNPSWPKNRLDRQISAKIQATTPIKRLNLGDFWNVVMYGACLFAGLFVSLFYVHPKSKKTKE